MTEAECSVLEPAARCTTFGTRATCRLPQTGVSKASLFPRPGRLAGVSSKMAKAPQNSAASLYPLESDTALPDIGGVRDFISASAVVGNL